MIGGSCVYFCGLGLVENAWHRGGQPRFCMDVKPGDLEYLRGPWWRVLYFHRLDIPANNAWGRNIVYQLSIRSLRSRKKNAERMAVDMPIGRWRNLSIGV